MIKRDFPSLLFAIPVTGLVPLLFFILFTAAPATYAGNIQEITAPEVKNMLETNKQALLINVLSKIEFDGLHISGSINIPSIDFPDSKLLPTDKQTPIITYCMGHN